MQENRDNLPRNLLFMIALLGSAVAAYFLNSGLFSLLQFVFDIKVNSIFTRILDGSSLWGIASYWSTFSLLMFLSAFLIPAVVNIVGLVSLKGRISELPRASDNAQHVTKEKFLKVMSEFKLVYAEFAVPYASYIIERQEKDIRKKTTFIGKGKAKVMNPVIVSVLTPASQIFKIDRILNSRLSVWFMRPMPRVLIGIGFLLFIVSFAGALQSDNGTLVGNETFLMGASSFALCIGVGVFMTAMFRVFMGHIYHRAAEVVKMIENLFNLETKEQEAVQFESVESALNKTVSTFKDFSKSINEKQEEAVNQLIVKTLEDYVKQIGKATTDQTKELQKLVDQLTKQSTEASKEISKRFEDYSKKIEETQKKLDMGQDKTFETISDKIEKLITSLNKEVSKASDTAFVKNSILEDLNKTAKDLGDVSKASDHVTAKFDLVSAGLDRLIAQVEKIAPMSQEKREHISAEIEELKRVSSSTVGMGRDPSASSRKKA
ncbi:MAG: hypothetical protein KDF58_13695 [Alphaproteobacteria bacterium]|nr:hypothetical protein [Alphaproteobacteria bacterium]HPF46407.1 hypothetical protein [Emcibacteraceae bacterium]